MTQEEIDQMTGAATMNKPSLAKRKTIRLNGRTGKIIVTHLDQDKVRGDDGVERYAQEELTDPINVVFLKVRRRLMQGSKDDGIIKYTTEHDTVNDVVTLYIKDGGTEQGQANKLREAYDELKTEQIVYVRYKGEVCKLSVKGLSLRGSDTTTNFYEYISGRNDWYSHMTKLVPTQDEDGGYWFFDFQAGEKLSDEQLETVIGNIKEVHEDCEKVKAAYADNVPIAQPDTATNESEQPSVPDYPEEEITPDDIPF